MAELTLLLGVVVGTVLGLTGAGGSVLAVPLLMAGLGWSLPQTAPVALLAVCVAAAFGTLAAWDVTFVRYRAAVLMAIAAWITAPLGLKAAAMVPVPMLTALFAAVVAAVALRMMWQVWRAPGETAVGWATVGEAARETRIALNEQGRIVWTPLAFALVGTIGGVTGLLAGLLGIGGGFVVVPALRALSPLSMHAAVATSLLVIALSSAGTVTAAVLQGAALPWIVALPFVAGALLGMLAGRKLAPRIAGPRLQQGFSILMLLVALGLAADVVGLL